MQCRKERSVCTVSSIAADEKSIVCALGSSGKVELWERRKLARVNNKAKQSALSQLLQNFHNTQFLQLTGFG